jgi:hypothetical protein
MQHGAPKRLPGSSPVETVILTPSLAYSGTIHLILDWSQLGCRYAQRAARSDTRALPLSPSHYCTDMPLFKPIFLGYTSMDSITAATITATVENLVGQIVDKDHGFTLPVITSASLYALEVHSNPTIWFLEDAKASGIPETEKSREW